MGTVPPFRELIAARHGYDDYGGPIVLPGGQTADTGDDTQGQLPAAAGMYPMRRRPRPAGNRPPASSR